MEEERKLERQATRLRKEIDGLDRYPTAPYPEYIRQKVAAFVERARQAQPAWAWKKISEHLGINHTSLSKWHEEYDGQFDLGEKATQMVPVQVSEETAKAGRPDGLSVRAGEVTIEGLSFEEAVEAARRLK